MPALAVYLLLSVASASSALLGVRLLEARSVRAGEMLYRLSLDAGPCFGARATEPGANCPSSHRLSDRIFAMQTWNTQVNMFPNGAVETKVPRFDVCQNDLGDSTLAPCEFGATEQEARQHIALFGDSHAGMWESALATFVVPQAIRVRSFIASACTVSTDDRALPYYLLPEYRDACRTWRRKAAEAILADKRIDTVIISDNAYEQGVLDQAGEWRQDDGHGIAEILHRFHAAGKRVIVIDDVPQLPFRLADCLAQARSNNDPCTFNRSQFPASNPLERAVALLPPGEIDYLNFKDVFCDGAVCHTVIGGIPAYMDSNHVTAPFARSLAPRIEKLIATRELVISHR